MIYGKLEDDKLVMAPKIYEDPETHTQYIPPSKELLEELGYKQIEYVEPPEPKENYILNYTWKEYKKKIKQIWTEEFVEPPAPEYTLEERLAILEGAFAELVASTQEGSEEQ